MKRHVSIALHLCCAIALFCSTCGEVTVVSNEVEAQKPVQLSGGSFDSEIRRVPSSYGLLVEFYAHWCPSCQAFQPTYEAVASYFHSEPRVQPEVWVARIDCADEAKICNRFGIKGYPTMKFGHVSDFEEGSEQGLIELNGKQTAEEVVKWLSKEMSTQYDYSTNKVIPHTVQNSSDASSAGTASSTETAHAIDIDSATRLAWKYMMDSGDLLKGADARQAFMNFMELMSASHPTASCKAGSHSILQQAPKLWPTVDITGPLPQLRDLQICGPGGATEEWEGCKGSKPGRRGYTCGLWLLLHSLAADSQPEDTGGAFWMTTVRGFIQHFFQCSACADHFVEMTEQPEAESVSSRRDAVLWMWKAHNQVNGRLQKQEKDGKDGDPAFPKQQWPPSQLCPLCHLPNSQETDPKWNEDEVYRFLLKYYSRASISRGVAESFDTQKAVKQLYDIGRNSAKGSHAVKVGLILLGLSAAALVACIRTRKAPNRKDRNTL